MDHNKLNIQEDIVNPLKTFFKESGIRLHRIKE